MMRLVARSWEMKNHCDAWRAGHFDTQRHTMAVIANTNTVTGAFAGFKTSLFNTGIFSSLYIAVIALAVNLVVSIVGSAAIPRKASSLQKIQATVRTA